MAEVTTDPALVPADEDTSHIDHSVAEPSKPTPSKERHSLTLDQRRALRRWANSQSVRPSHKACIEWFFSQYGQHISQSTVSHSLSPKYSRLDGEVQHMAGSRLRFGNWPDVEKLVLRWYQQVQNTGRQPTNEELGEKAKAVFAQLPRYKEDAPPEFSPGWIHRFKKRYGLLVRRQRRQGDPELDMAEDINYLADCLPRFMEVSQGTSPAAIREQIARGVGVEPTLGICALVRDEVIRRMSQQQPLPPSMPDTEPPTLPPPQPEQSLYGDEDPDIVLQNALRQLQQEEDAAEQQAAAAREERERQERAVLHPMESTPHDSDSVVGRFHSPVQDIGPPPDLTLTPIQSNPPVVEDEPPVRCPYCINQRMLRSIKEAVEHLSTHVVV